MARPAAQSAFAAVRRNAVALVLASILIGGCAPEVGSERWCGQMDDKPAGDWTANEALDYGRHCAFR
jgi:hypothetical protein